MRGLALSLAIAVVLAGLGQAKAELPPPILYEGFSCYCEEQRDLHGLEEICPIENKEKKCSWGFAGPWQVVTSGDHTENWAFYEPEGLEFGHLVVDRRPDGTPLGKARICAGEDYVHVKGVRQLALKAPDPFPPDGYTLWGSYLWARVTYSPDSHWQESMSALLVNKKRVGDDRSVEFYAAGDRGIRGGVGIRDSGHVLSRDNEGEPITDFDPYLVIFKVTGLGTDEPAISEWILNLDQFRHFKPPPDGSLTEDELNQGVPPGPADDRVWQKQPQPLTSSVLIEYPLDMFLGLMSYDGGITPVGMVNDFDELRIANGNGDDGLNKVTPIVPEPPTFVLTVVAVLGLAAYARRRRAYDWPVRTDRT